MKIVGCGTGRCGTHSLSTLIDGCEGWTCYHETRPLLPWKVDKVLAYDRIERFNSYDNVGDVAFFYLPYIEMFLDKIEDLKVISLKRDVDDTVESYARNTEGKNHWVKHNGEYWNKDWYDKCYPKYNLDQKEKELAIRKYWHEYYEYSEWLQDEYPNRFKVYQVDVLNDREKQLDMFDFLEIDNPNVQIGIKENVTNDSS